ncbi:MAG: Mur ligase domain-containing protein, partial [Cyanobacteria bacterium J06633_1]
LLPGFLREVTNSDLDQSVCGITTDTRTIKPQELFVALVGENFDGHNFVKQADWSKSELVTSTRFSERSY